MEKLLVVTLHDAVSNPDLCKYLLLNLMCPPSSFSSSFSEENHNVWCPLLELFFHWRIGRCMEAMVDEVSTAQVALTCHFALDVLCEK